MSIAKSWLGLGLMTLVACGAGCSDDDDSNQQQQDTGIRGDGTPHWQDGFNPTGDGGNPVECQCTAAQVCASDGTCIPVPQPQPTDYVGEVFLLRQTDLTQRTPLAAVWPTVGKPDAGFRLHEPLPEDFRESFTTAEGETCYYEFSTNYPWSLPDYDWWPKGVGMDAGTLTIKISGGPSDIVLTRFEGSGSDWIYTLESPEHLSQGSSSYPQFLDQQYVPAGARFTVEAAGGAHFAAQTFSGGLIPLEFNMTTPNYEQAGATNSYGADVPVSWSPAQPSATMKIYFTQSMGLESIHRVTCQVKDDGQALIPAAVFGSYSIGEIGVYMERDAKRYVKGTAVNGANLHLDLLGRHARYGYFEFTM